MAATRPYLLVYKGETHIIEAPSAAHSVQHVVGADISELRPARAAEVTAWVRGGKPIPLAGEKVAAAVGTQQADNADFVLKPNLAGHEAALIYFEDWAGFDRAESTNTKDAADTVATFARMHPSGQMDLMTFDVLRQRAPEFGFAIVAAEMAVPRSDDAIYVPAVEAAMEAGLARVRARLEDQPMPFGDVVKAVIRHAGQEQPAA